MDPLNRAVCMLVAPCVIAGAFSVAAGAIQVSVATDQSNYVVGDPITYSVIATNPMSTSVNLAFGSSLQANFTVDGFYTPYTIGVAIPTSRLVPPFGSVTWDFLHPWSDFSLSPGLHSVAGNVIGYGTSLPAAFTISSPAPVNHDEFIDFEHYPSGAPTHNGNHLTYGMWQDAFARDGVRFHSQGQGGSVNLEIGTQGAQLYTPTISYPTGANVVADFSMPVYSVSADVGSAANCTVTMIASDAGGHVLGSVTSGPVTNYPSLVGPISFDSPVPIASVQWFSSLANAAVLIDNLNLNVDLAETHGDFNNDGQTDAADYAVWRNTLGTVVPIGSNADANHNGMIDDGDYSVWKTQFGWQSAASPMAVPEPSTVALLTALALTSVMLIRTLRYRKV